jgi:hypothetical protein
MSLGEERYMGEGSAQRIEISGVSGDFDRIKGQCEPDLVWKRAPLITKRRFDSGGFFLGFWDDHGRNRERCEREGMSSKREKLRSGACLLRCINVCVVLRQNGG